MWVSFSLSGWWSRQRGLCNRHPSSSSGCHVMSISPCVKIITSIWCVHVWGNAYEGEMASNEMIVYMLLTESAHNRQCSCHTGHWTRRDKAKHNSEWYLILENGHNKNRYVHNSQRHPNGHTRKKQQYPTKRTFDNLFPFSISIICCHCRQMGVFILSPIRWIN